MVRLIASVRPAALAAALVAVALAGDVRLAAAEPAAAPSVDEYRKLIWKRQFGSSEYDAARGVATDADGNVLVTGITQGPLGGAYEGGYFDAFVAKYTAGGDRLWLRHLGTSEEDGSAGVATDAAGNILIAGHTWGSLEGANQGLGADAYVAKYNAGGDLLWIRQFGTSDPDPVEGVATDTDGNVLITGGTYGSLDGPNQGGIDVFVATYSSAGDPLWVRQLGTTEYDSVGGVATDTNNNVLITGWTTGPLGGPHHGRYTDVFVAKYNAAGEPQWTRQLGKRLEDDLGRAVAADVDGNVVVSGYTSGSLGGPNRGSNDAFVAKYSAAGDLLWRRRDDGA